MSYEVDGSVYSQATVTNTETGVTITQWDQVNIGSSKAVWDVAEIFADGRGGVRLHRQAHGRVMYRREQMDRLTKVVLEEPHVKLSRKWAARVKDEALEAGQLVSAARIITDSQNRILHTWWEPAVITEIRNFDALVRFADGTVQSSGIGLKAFELPTMEGK